MMNFVFIYLWGFHSFLNECDYCRIMCHMIRPLKRMLSHAFQYSLVGGFVVATATAAAVVMIIYLIIK